MVMAWQDWARLRLFADLPEEQVEEEEDDNEVKQVQNLTFECFLIFRSSFYTKALLFRVRRSVTGRLHKLKRQQDRLCT